MFILKNKNKGFICKKYQEDIWGTYFLHRKLNRVSKLLLAIAKENAKRNSSKDFFLSVTVLPPIRRRKRLSKYGELLDLRKKLCFYYGGLRKKTYRNICFKALKAKGSFEVALIGFLESMLLSVLFRLNFCTSIFEAEFFIKNGWVLVNKEVIRKPRHFVNIGDIVEVIEFKKLGVFKYLLSSLLVKKIIIIEPLYLCINYFVLSGLILKQPSLKEIFYPFKLEKKLITAEFYQKL